MSRAGRWWRHNWDYLLLVTCLLVVAWMVGATISAIMDTVRQVTVR